VVLADEQAQGRRSAGTSKRDGGGGVNGRRTIDVSGVQTFAFGSRSIMWWGTILTIAIEATVFIVTIAAYFYLQGNEVTWPPGNIPAPGLQWPTINVIILLFSLIPNQLAKNAAENLDTHRVRVWMVVADLFALAFVIVRAFEYRDLHVSWDTNAYGSATWTLLSFHTFHVVTDFADSIVLTVLMFTQHGLDAKRHVDVSENAFYWYFVVLSYLPIYFVLYWVPRLL
jgi:heme/copper-type cytochrome/quinol oxidase subunit 3